MVTKPKKQDKKAATKAKAKAAEADLKAVETSTYTELAATAKEINQVMELAARADQQADDRRLTAAIALEKARKLCEKRKVNFKKWCEREIKEQSYETIRKLVAIGGAPNPKLALQDMRNKNKKANKKHREAQKQKALGAPAAPTETPYVRAEKALAAMKDKDQHTFLDSKANKLGFRVISAGDAKVLEQVKRGNVSTPTIAPSKQSSVDPVKAAEEAFLAIPKAGQQLAFVKWAVAKVGGKFVDGFDAGEDGLEIPAALDRRGKEAVAATAPVTGRRAKVAAGKAAAKTA